jgi:hypothetical protein
MADKTEMVSLLGSSEWPAAGPRELQPPRASAVAVTASALGANRHDPRLRPFVPLLKATAKIA